VLDPLPNMHPEWVAERMRPLIARLRQAHPRTPIVLVEHAGHANAPVLETHHPSYEESNASLRRIYEELRKAGDRNLFYVRGNKLVGADGLATVDGIHPTDLGFMRMADAMEPVLKRALRAAR
jgi:lysophospholipase L1-like esterase